MKIKMLIEDDQEIEIENSKNQEENKDKTVKDKVCVSSTVPTTGIGKILSR